MNRQGECYDNAVMERFVATLKVECVTGVYATRAARRRCISACIEVRYNRQWRHATRDDVSPAACEQARDQTTAVS